MTAKKTTEVPPAMTDAPPPDTAATEGTSKYDEAVRGSYAYASKVLREENELYFNQLRTDFIQRAGFAGWEPESVKAKRKAEAKQAEAEAKAKAKLEKMYEQFPHLAPEGWQPAGGTEARPEA